jgi:hypothetical protein
MSADLRYPIGKFNGQPPTNSEERRSFLNQVEETPARLRAAIEGLTEEQLNTPYRDGGWTIRQVVHHVPDSHLNSYIRFKWALTENEPLIKAYHEDRWAELQDSKSTPVQVSLTLLHSLHERWMNLLRSFNSDDWKKTLRHPELGVMTLEKMLALYAWHGRHHVAHITSLRERMGW